MLSHDKPSLCILSQNRAHAVFSLSHIWRNTDGTLFVYDSVNFNHFHSDSVCLIPLLWRFISPFVTMSVFYCFCNKLPQTSWFKTIHMHYVIVLEVRRLTGLTELKSCHRVVLILEALRRLCFLLFPDFIGHLHALACGPLSILKASSLASSKPSSNSDLCSAITPPSLWLPCLSLSFLRTLVIPLAHLDELPD